MLLQGLCLLDVRQKKNQLVPADGILQRWSLCCGGVLYSTGRSKGVKQHDKTRSQQLVLFYLCICMIRFYMIKLFHKVAVTKLWKVLSMFQLVGSRMWDATDGQMCTLISHEKLYLIHLGLFERDFKLKVLSKYPPILKLFWPNS